MNILFIKHFCVGFIVSEITRVSIFGYFPLYTFPYICVGYLLVLLSVKYFFYIMVYGMYNGLYV